jgi:putative FmdB family regulatory protein
MPLHEYECRTCKSVFEAYRRPGEDASNEPCPACGERAAKVGVSIVSGCSPKTPSPSACGSGGRRTPFR